jgi:hypothetical protein
MKVYIVCTPDMTPHRISQINKHFKPMNRPMEFIFDRSEKIDFVGLQTVEFEDLFQIAANYRNRNTLVEDSDFVVTLTGMPNSKNYFAKLQEENIRNAFVHDGDWELYVRSDTDIPAAFTILNIVLLGLAVRSHDEVDEVVHLETIGCIMDFCKNKNDVRFKFKTADICVDCVNRLLERNVPTLKIEQALILLERLRTQMKESTHFHRKFQVSRLQIDTQNNRLILKDYDNAEVLLGPIDFAFYLLMLKLKDGVNFKELCNHEDEFRKLYIPLSGKNPEYQSKELNDSVKRAVRPVNGSASEMSSHIKSAFEAAVGPNFSKPYIIDGPNRGKKGISLDRETYVVGWPDFMG